MKLGLLFVMLILVLPFSVASIGIGSGLQGEYNLGDEISFSIRVLPDETFDALVKLTMKCTEKDVPYFIYPVSLEEDVEESIDVPAIKAFSEGLCSIRVNIENLEGGGVEGITSKDFTVSSDLELEVTLDKEDVLPGDKIKVKGVAKKKGGGIDDGNVVISLGGEKIEFELEDDEFDHAIELKEDIRSGEHKVIVEVEDSHGNFNAVSKTINVKAVPSLLEFKLNKQELSPKEVLKVTAVLLDQAGDNMDGSVDVKLFKSKFIGSDVVVFDTGISANNEKEFSFENTLKPDDYMLEGVFEGLQDEVVVKILPNEEIAMELEGEIVTVSNVGNVDYNDKSTIVLDEGERNFIINKRIRLDVGESMTLDLSKEVPSGSYTVNLPEGVVEGVDLEDDRSAIRKIVSFVTGSVVAGAGLIIDRPGLASFLMIMIILGIIGYYNRDRIIGRIKEKREENI